MHTSSVRGRQRRHRETQRGGASAEASPGPCGVLVRAGSRATVLPAAPMSRGYAEAGESPSSEAPPEESPEAIGGRRLSTKPGAVKPVRPCTRESDSPEGTRLVSRLQKLVRRIFLVKAACEATRSHHGRIV